MIGNKTIVGLVIATMVLSCVAVAVTADEGRVEPMAIFPASITDTEIAASAVGNSEIINTDLFALDGGITVDSTHFTVSGSTGAITVQPGYGLDANSTGDLKLGDGTATGILIGTTAATDIDIGAGGTIARSIDIGNGTGIDTINIGTGANRG